MLCAVACSAPSQVERDRSVESTAPDAGEAVAPADLEEAADAGVPCDAAAHVVADKVPGGDPEIPDGRARGADEEHVLREARGVWVTRWDYRTPDEIATIMDDVSAAGFNQVYFQVRGAGDAYYRSRLVPWAAALSGKLGRDPGWDPLQAAIEQAHARGLELHAWINVATAWKGALPPGRSRPRHILRTHPRWRVVDRRGRPMPYSDGAYVFVCPANPAFQQHIQAVVAELASFYEVDGIHLDYARYPAADTSYDRVSNRLYRKARKKEPGLTRADWQRRTLTRLIAAIKRKVSEVRPHARVSAAVTGIYRDRWGWGGVTRGYVDFYQDSRAWARQHAVDVLVPMIYWKPTRPPGGRADFRTLVEDVLAVREQVQLLVGINVEAGAFPVLAEEIRIVRENGCDGMVLFAYAALRDRDWFDLLRRTVFSQPAAPPGPRPASEPIDWRHVGRLLVQGLAAALSPVRDSRRSR